MTIANTTNHLDIGGYGFPIVRLPHFGLVITGPATGAGSDYLHDVLLSPAIKESFFELIDREGLIVCKNVETQRDTYRRVRGKSSGGKLSQAEYYHHDGCSCPTKPRFVEIRLPQQKISRQIATAIAPFVDVVRAMLDSLPKRLKAQPEIANSAAMFAGDVADYPPVEEWDKIQGRVTRIARREMDAEGCRAYFREVDSAANAYDEPWEMGESRLMSNNQANLAATMQHRRAYPQPRMGNQQNGSLVKRWTAEEL